EDEDRERKAPRRRSPRGRSGAERGRRPGGRARRGGRDPGHRRFPSKEGGRDATGNARADDRAAPRSPRLSRALPRSEKGGGGEDPAGEGRARRGEAAREALARRACQRLKKP